MQMPRDASLIKTKVPLLFKDLVFPGLLSRPANIAFCYPRTQGRVCFYFAISLCFSCDSVARGDRILLKAGALHFIALNSPLHACQLKQMLSTFFFQMRKLKCASFPYFWQWEAPFLWGTSGSWRYYLESRALQGPGKVVIDSLFPETSQGWTTFPDCHYLLPGLTIILRIYRCKQPLA